MLLALALACSTGFGPVASPPEPPEPPEPPVPSAPVAASLPATPAPRAPALPVDGGERFGDRWVVILSSSKTPGALPEGLATLEASALPRDVARLASSEFKGLMPCWEVVVANAFAKRQEAVDYSKQLTALGIDNYPKNTGKWVGPQPRVEAWCSGERERAESACDAGLRFVERHGGAAYMHLALDEELAARVLERAPKAKPLDESKTAWSAPLAHETVGDLAKGAAITAWDAEGKAASCTVAGFAALTRGAPHFGWYESGAQDAPGCGSPEVFARLDCPAGAWAWAAPSATALAVPLPAPVAPEAGARAVAALTAHPAWAAARGSAEEAASAQGEPLKEEVGASGHLLGERLLVLVQARLLTREGDDMCGSDDVNVHLAGVAEIVGSDAKVLMPFARAGEGAIRLLDVGADGAPELQRSGWTGTVEILGADGAPTCAISQGYCDCPC